MVWIVVIALLLGTVYYVDRAGWIWFRLTGYNVTLEEELSGSIDLPVRSFIDRNQIFSVDPENPTGLVLRKGKYDISRTTLIPPGLSLTVEPGTVLQFAAGRSLISYSPIIARGTKSEPILFTARNKFLKWGVVGVVGPGRSVFEYTRFEHGRQALVNNIDFFGSLSLIGADVEIRHSQFVNLFGKDAVYVREGQVLIRENLFWDTYKDCLDLDAGTGEISHNQFINCGDEGIDLSENQEVQVFDNRILDSKGGRISADKDLEAIKARNIFGYPGGN